MGKHSAPPAVAVARTSVVPPTPAAPPRPTSGPTHVAPSAQAAIPKALAQSAAFGVLAIVVAVIALVWAGVDHRVTAAVALGLLLIGVVGFVVVQHTGLLADDARVDEHPAGSAPPL